MRYLAMIRPEASPRAAIAFVNGKVVHSEATFGKKP